jgi:hypothetical protein
VGVLLSLLAALIFGFAAPKLAWSWVVPERRGSTGQEALGRKRFQLRYATYLLIATSVSLFIVANRVHLISYEDSELPSKYVWWLSVGVFVLALFLTQRLERIKEDYERSPPFTSWNYLCLGGITLLALAIRFYDIVDTPVVVNVDNAGAMLAAQEDLRPSHWIAPGIRVFGIPSLALLFVKISAWSTAPDIFALRAPEAILGTLMVMGAYLFVWRSFDSHKLAALSAGLLTVHAGHIHFSRHIMNVDPWTFAIFGFLLVVHGVRCQRVWALGAAGLVLGFSLQLYLSIRVLILAAPLFVVYLMTNRRAAITNLLAGWLLFVTGVAVMIGPNFADTFVNRQPWAESNRSWASLLTIQTLYDFAQPRNLTSVLSVVGFQTRQVLLIPQALFDNSTQIAMQAPLFDLLIAPLLWLGLGSSIASWRRSPPMAWVLLASGIVVLMGQALFPNMPLWPRLIFIMFAGCLWIAMAILSICQVWADIMRWATRRVPKLGDRLLSTMRPILWCVLCALTLMVGHRQWQVYASDARSNIPADELAGRFIYRLPKNVAVCGVRGADELHVGLPLLQFYAQGRVLKELGPRPALDVADQCGSAPFGWIVGPNQEALKDKLLALYPSGILKAHHDKKGVLILWTFYVP